MNSNARIEYAILILLLAPLLVALIPDQSNLVISVFTHYPGIGYPINETQFTSSINNLENIVWYVLIGGVSYLSVMLIAIYWSIKKAGIPELTKFSLIALGFLYVNDIKSAYLLGELIDNSSINILIERDFEIIRDGADIHNFIILIGLLCVAVSKYNTGNITSSIILVIIVVSIFIVANIWPSKMICYRWGFDWLVITSVHASWILQQKRVR